MLEHDRNNKFSLLKENQSSLKESLVMRNDDNIGIITRNYTLECAFIFYQVIHTRIHMVKSFRSIKRRSKCVFNFDDGVARGCAAREKLESPDVNDS